MVQEFLQSMATLNPKLKSPKLRLIEACLLIYFEEDPYLKGLSTQSLASWDVGNSNCSTDF